MLHLSFLPASIFLLSVPFVFCLPSIRLPCLCLFIVALAQVSEYCTLDLPLQTLNRHYINAFPSFTFPPSLKPFFTQHSLHLFLLFTQPLSPLSLPFHLHLNPSPFTQPHSTFPLLFTPLFNPFSLNLTPPLPLPTKPFLT